MNSPSWQEHWHRYPKTQRAVRRLFKEEQWCSHNIVHHQVCTTCSNYGSISHRQSYLCQKLLRLKTVTMEVPQPCAWYQMLLWKQYFQKSFLSTSGPHKWPGFQLFFILVHMKCQGLSKVKENKTEKYPERHAKNWGQICQYSGSSTINLSINIMPKDLSLSSLRSFFLQAPFPPGWHSLILLLFEIKELFGFVTEWL